MDEITRAELEKLHGRINDLKERVVTLEAQGPHINAALLRLEKSVEVLGEKFEASVKAIGDKLGKLFWVIATPLLAIIIGAVAKSLLSGALAVYL